MIIKHSDGNINAIYDGKIIKTNEEIEDKEKKEEKLKEKNSDMNNKS
jgi:hypothetical protein